MNTSYYKFAQFDPRPQGNAANELIFVGPVLGIEVTIPALASKCTLGNIDPQHSDQNASQAAIEVALICELPVEGATLATVRTDLDSIGAMAVLEWRKFAIKTAEEEIRQLGSESPLSNADLNTWSPNKCAKERIRQVADADKFARGEWPGMRPLPTNDNPWPTEGSADSTRFLAAINAAVQDFKIPLADRVSTMQRWLETGEEPVKYREQVKHLRQELVRALVDGTITAKRVEYANGALALVESTYPAATMVGYTLAPVVVAFNPSFKVGAGEPYRKFTICAYSAKHADIRSALTELAGLEPGWAGSPTIGGSSQGVSSTLSVEQVIEVVSRHLK